METWSLGPEDGTLTLRTGVAGRAARMGHRLTLAPQSWSATVDWVDDRPAAVRLTVDVDSLQVESGEGGVTPLTGAEKAVARGNALKTLGGSTFPTVEFRADSVTPDDDGYRLAGTVTIHGSTQPIELAVTVTRVDAAWQIDGEAIVEQTAFGIKPFSMMMGAMKVADAVTVTLSATVTGTD